MVARSTFDVLVDELVHRDASLLELLSDLIALLMQLVALPAYQHRKFLRMGLGFVLLNFLLEFLQGFSLLIVLAHDLLMLFHELLDLFLLGDVFLGEDVGLVTDAVAFLVKLEDFLPFQDKVLKVLLVGFKLFQFL